jgi:hypothetical protein
MDTPDRAARARTRDAVLALVCYLGVLAYSVFGAIATRNAPWGSSTTEVVVVGILIGLSLGLAISGVRGLRLWARALSAAVMLLALLHVLEPLIMLNVLAALFR